jgi:glutathione peroxidase
MSFSVQKLFIIGGVVLCIAFIFSRFSSSLKAKPFDGKNDKTENLSSNIYDYSFTSLTGKTISLKEFKGKKILFVNTASECGFTPQYEKLEAVYEKYKDKLVIIGFPTNDFGRQEPGDNEQIASFCKNNYSVSFPMSEKITVKGNDMSPIYKWLTKKSLNGKLDTDVKWNFQKYLIDENGNFVTVFYSKVKPDDKEIIEKIQ